MPWFAFTMTLARDRDAEHAGEFTIVDGFGAVQFRRRDGWNRSRQRERVNLGAFRSEVVFSRRNAQRNASRRSDARLQSRWFARWNQSPKHSPNSIRLCWDCQRWSPSTFCWSSALAVSPWMRRGSSRNRTARHEGLPRSLVIATGACWLRWPDADFLIKYPESSTHHRHPCLPPSLFSGISEPKFRENLDTMDFTDNPDSKREEKQWKPSVATSLCEASAPPTGRTAIAAAQSKKGSAVSRRAL